MKKYRFQLSLILAFLIALSSLVTVSRVHAKGAEPGLSYSFSNSKAGYAEGKLTLTVEASGKYKLYWANDNSKLSGYYPITELSLSDKGSNSFSFGYHTAIPYSATRIIATDSNGKTTAEFTIPENKRLSYASGSLRYKFNAYSDIHIDSDGYYKKSADRFARGLQYGVDTGTDFIITSGDSISNTSEASGDWKKYEQILSESNYVNPIWESNGNHDLRNGSEKGKMAYIRASGTDSTIANYDAYKPYYCMTEKKTGDIFIFMALEKESNPSKCDEFSDAQINWVTNTIDKNYKKGVNIYIVEHAPIAGFGAGDRMSKQYYKALLSKSYGSTVKFQALLKKYPGLIFVSGHTHEDFSMDYNFSDEKGTACSMLHIPSLAGSTMPNSSDSALDYNKGNGYNSQGYLVEAYDNEIVFYGANITDKLIYPAYSYIMEGYSSKNTSIETNPTSDHTVETETDTPIGCTIPEGTETRRVYFADSLQWRNVYCHSWMSGSTVKSVWPGYAANFYGTTEEGIDLYYADIPKEHTGIVWNNGDEDEQTKDITLDETNNFFTPKDGQSGKKIEVTSEVWSYAPVTEPPTDPVETDTDPTTSTEATTSDASSPTTANSTGTDATEDKTNSSESGTTATTDKEDTATKPNTEADPTSSEKDTTATDPDKNSDKETTVTKPGTESTSKPNGGNDEKSTEEATITEFKKGDVNTDGNVDIRDVTAIQKHIAYLIKLSDEALKLADVDLSKTVNIKDATYIQKYINGVYNEFPTEPSNSKTKASSGTTDYKQYLETNYSFASYDQYQALKKLYKNNGSETEIEAAYIELKTIVDHISESGPSNIPSNSFTEVYFENTKDWSKVYGYAWTGSNKNEAWPGVKLSKAGTNKGHDVYKLSFSSAGQYKSVIFNGGDNTHQTVNINLDEYSKNAFYISDKDSEGKYKVNNFSFSE